MMDRPQKKKLAYQIGLCRIALIVEEVDRRMKTHPVFERLFEGTANEGEQRARLTYFWWVVLGGNKLSKIELEIIEEFTHAAASRERLDEWIAVFRQTAFLIIGEELTNAWTQKVEHLARVFLLTEEDDGVDLAKAC